MLWRRLFLFVHIAYYTKIDFDSIPSYKETSRILSTIHFFKAFTAEFIFNPNST